MRGRPIKRTLRECATLLEDSDLRANRIADSYLVPFVEAG